MRPFTICASGVSTVHHTLVASLVIRKMYHIFTFILVTVSWTFYPSLSSVLPVSCQIFFIILWKITIICTIWNNIYYFFCKYFLGFYFSNFTNYILLSILFHFYKHALPIAHTNPVHVTLTSYTFYTIIKDTGLVNSTGVLFHLIDTSLLLLQELMKL